MAANGRIPAAVLLVTLAVSSGWSQPVPPRRLRCRLRPMRSSAWAVGSG